MGILCGQSAQIWFAPLDDINRQAFPGRLTYSGPTDYLNLFAPGAPWEQAAGHVSVFKFYTQPFTGAELPNFNGSFSDSQLQQIFSFLQQHNIAVAIEFGPLTPSATCGNGVEGFEGGVASAQMIVDRFKANGGTLNYVAMDEPFWDANIYSGTQACNWSAQEIATNALATLNVLKTAFPDLVIGDIEPVPGVGATDWVQRYAAWMDAFEAATGSKLAFFDSDTNQIYPTWMSDIASLRVETSQRGISLGIIYDGFVTDSSDQQWTTRAEEFFTEYELSNPQPDQAIFQSWMNYPMHCLPETTPYTFTWLIDQYTRPRPSLSVSVASSEATGKLLNNSGNGIASTPIAVTLQPTAGPGIIATYTLTGTVPATISTAGIQICVNMCGSQGTNNMSVYSFQYTDSGNHASFDFSKGLTGWGVDPSGTASVQSGSDSGGPYLSVAATAAQSTYINAPSFFAVTPSSSYTLTVTARISPASTASGYFALIFFTGPPCSTLCPVSSAYTEVSRDTLAYAPGTVTLGMPQTGSDGSYTLQFSPVDTAGSFQVTAYYAGSDVLWPAQATAVLDGTPSISASGIVNAADFKVEALSPGAWFTIFGQNLGNAGQWTSSSTLTVGGAAVSVCGIPAVVSYNSGPIITNGSATWQLNALVPDGVAGQSSCPVIVTVNGVTSQGAAATIKGGIMELFTFASPAGTLPIVTHADYSLVGPSSANLKPAQPGETVIAWGTGDCTLPTVAVGNANASVSFSGRVAPGLCQVNFSVPSGVSGASPLQISTSLSSYILWVAP
jgi:uncharacterized protein (TIGR03437 family)